MTAQGERIRAGLWWVSPPGAIAMVVLPTLLLAASIDDTTFRSAWRVAKYLQPAFVTMILVGALVAIAASLVPLYRTPRRVTAPWPGFGESTYQRLVTAANWLFALTLVGYLGLGVSGLRNGVRPQDIVTAVIGQDTYSGVLKEAFASIPGVTTLTQVGIAFTVVAALLWMRGRRGYLVWQAATVLALTLARSFLLTERLALLELAIPVVAVVALAWANHHRRGIRWVVRLGPVVMVPAILLVFAVFEYSRSWVYFSATRGGSFLDFAVERFAGYYATAYNNGQIAMLFERVPGALPYRSLEGLWTAPIVEQLDLYGLLTGDVVNNDATTVLTAHGNPEFNNMCGICDPFVDWGPVGGVVFLAAIGLVLGIAYRGCTEGRPTWVLLYPPMVTGLLELPRYLYFVQGRLVPAVLALLVVAAWVRPGRGREGPAVPAANLVSRGESR